MKRKCIAGALLVTGALGAGSALAALKPGPGDVPFWIGIQDLQQMDRQVARLLEGRAMVIALRTPDTDSQGAQLRAMVSKLKQELPQTPVLMYSWSSRNLRGKKGSVGVMDWLDQHRELQIHQSGNDVGNDLANGDDRPNGKGKGKGGGQGLSRFGDVSQPDYRARTASSIAAAVDRTGFDGVILDMSIRTPQYKPLVLAKICASSATFCARYGEGMDATFGAIRAALGDRPIVYNGLWNFGPGSVADQQKLLDHADAAAIEYFGGDPKERQHSFSQDILPFLEAMKRLPEGKEILAFGRGSLRYVSYADDYAWQRYLYCAYFLAARDNTYFKYHSTFQADVPQGRTGGLDVYADWSSKLGAPSKAYSVTSGLYSRPFAKGLVIVAPDDGRGGGYDLPHPMYSPEGDKYEGHVSLQPGKALLLLDSKQPLADSSQLLDLGLLSDWPGAALSRDGSASVLALQAGTAVGSHDMLLDAIRSPHPHNTLQFSVQPGDRAAQMAVVAEVDDPSHNQQFAILAIDGSGGASGGTKTMTMTFRASASRRSGFPVVQGPKLASGAWQTINLDGRAIFAKTGLTFRRWDYVRFTGAMKLKAVRLAD